MGGAVRHGRVWLGVALLVFTLALVAALWRATPPAGADPVGVVLDRSEGEQPGPCPDWVDTHPEDVTCTPTEHSIGRGDAIQWGHWNLWLNVSDHDHEIPVGDEQWHDNCGDRWGTEEDPSPTSKKYPSAAAAKAAADVGRSCLHNRPGWRWQHQHKRYETRWRQVTETRHTWVIRKGPHTNCGTEWPESHIHPDGELDVPDAPKDATEAGLNHFHWTVRVTWGAPDDDGGCPVLGYEVRVTAANDPPGTAPVTHQFTDTRFPHEEPVPTVATGVKTVEIRARNVKGLGDPARVRLHPRCPRGTDHQGDLISSVDGGTEAGCNETDDDTCPAVPGVPTRERQSGVDHRTWAVRVSWDAPTSDGDAGTLCNVTGYEVRVVDAATGATRTRAPDYGTAVSDRRHDEQAATTATGTKTVEIRARNEKGLGDPARVPLHPRCPRGSDHQGDLISTVEGGTEAGCNDEPPPEDRCPPGTTHEGKLLTHPDVGGTVEGCNDDGCAVPDAPVVLGPGAAGTGSQQVVTWTVDDPAGVGCEITGQQYRRVPQRGNSITYDRDAGRRSERVTVTDRTGEVVVSVRAKNRVRPGSSDEQWGGWGHVTLSPPVEERPSRCEEYPDEPVLRAWPPSGGRVRVTWSVRSDGGRDCRLIGYEVAVGSEPVESFTGRRRYHWIAEPPAGERVTVEVRVRNEFGWSFWGAVDVAGPCLGLPAAPDVYARNPRLDSGRLGGWYRDVWWAQRDDGGCPITMYEWSGFGSGTVRAGEAQQVSVRHPNGGTRTIWVRARNALGWGPRGKVDLEACFGLPAAPTVTGRQVYGGGHQLAVSWSSGEEGGWCQNNQYEGRLVGGTSWRTYDPSIGSRDLRWQPSVTETPVVRVRARNDKGWGPWGEGTFTVCPAAPATPEVTVGAWGVHPDEWGTPGQATKVSWAYPSTGGQHCTVLEYEYKTSGRSRQANRLLRTFNPHQDRVTWQDEDDSNADPDGWVTRAWDGTLEWLEPNVTTRPVTVRVRARNQYGWGEWGTAQLTLPEVPDTCTGPPGAPVLTVGQPHHVPDPSMDWFREVVRNGLHTRRWVTVSWDDIHDGGWTCTILEQYAYAWETLSDDAEEWENGFDWLYTVSPHARSINVLVPEAGGVTTVQVRARNQFGWGPTALTQVHPQSEVACAGPPVAPVLVWDHVYDGPAWTKLTTVAEMGGEGCAVVRYDTEYQHQSTTFADTYLAFLPDDPWFGTSKRQFRRIGEPTGATGHITYRVRAVNHRDGGTSTTPRSQPCEVRV